MSISVFRFVDNDSSKELVNTNENTHTNTGTKRIKKNTYVYNTDMFYQESKTKIQNDPGLECELT